MYCRQCGQAINAQPYCPNCGASTGLTGTAPGLTPAPAAAFGAGSRLARHLRTLGILWVVFSIYLLLQLLVVLPILHAVFGGRTPWVPGSGAWIYAPFHPGGWLLHVIAVAVVIRVILSLAVGIALLTRQPWGRVFSIVIAVLTLLKPVVGTILAIYTLWVLLSQNAGQEYDRITLSRDVPIL